MKGSLCIFHQIHDLTGPVTQEDPVFCQSYFPFSADKKLPAKLLFQIHHLFGQGGLGNKQRLGGFCNILFPRYGEKIMQ